MSELVIDFSFFLYGEFKGLYMGMQLMTNLLGTAHHEPLFFLSK